MLYGDLKMPIVPTTYFVIERRFVDRETYIQAFKENIQNSMDREYNVLFYYGIAGIGKSKLQQKLQEILEEEYPEILWAPIDLDIKTYRDIGTFLITLRNKIQEKHNAKFHLFNSIHAIYWKKLHPEHPSVANSLNNLAVLYRSMGSYDKALPLYQRALNILEKVLGPEHPSVATTLNNLA
jgi:tetratricopeptide (TPR) repeat protein